MSIRRAASWGHALQEIADPRGARTSRGPVTDASSASSAAVVVRLGSGLAEVDHHAPETDGRCALQLFAERAALDVAPAIRAGEAGPRLSFRHVRAHVRGAPVRGAPARAAR